MSRLYLVTLLLFLTANFGLAQQKDVAKLLKAGDLKKEKGDYIFALSYYEQAMKIDSNTIDVLWKMAEGNKAYKDYRKAEYYYGKVYERENTRLYPSSILNYGLMLKYNGKYEEALSTFKKAVRHYNKDKKGYLYLKAKKEVESTSWAINNNESKESTQFVHLPDSINTPNSEFGHTLFNNELYFSSLRADSVNANEEVYSTHYKTKIYTSQLQDDTFLKDQLVEDFSFQDINTGNGSFSLDGKRFYFSVCKDNSYNYTCKIAVAEYEDGRFFDIDTLGDIINEKGANTTMPNIGQIDGREVLFFSSDRDKGDMNLYFSYITNGAQYSKPIAIEAINTIGSEITPFWDQEQQRLYFSSDWHNGYGGYDIFYSQYEGEKFFEPINIGMPYNSSANDYYYFQAGDSSYVTSNRIGVNYSKNPTCCTDIFLLHEPIIIKETPEEPVETLDELNKRLPVVLYFHNDWPDPRTTRSTTNIDYIDNYHDYRALLPTYKKEYSAGLDDDNSAKAQEDIEDFFIEYVDRGVQNLELFRDAMLKELDKGTALEITIKGFASPLAKTEYNINLTKRRINSLRNYLRRFNGGVFAKYIDNKADNGAYLKFKEIPFGEYNSKDDVSDNYYDVQKSVYSIAASLERKIEIQSVNILSKDSSNVIDALISIHHFGKIADDTVVSTIFKIKNVSDAPINFQNAEYDNDIIQLDYNKKSLQPNEIAEIKVTLSPHGKTGDLVLPIILKTLESNLGEQIVITAEVNQTDH